MLREILYQKPDQRTKQIISSFPFEEKKTPSDRSSKKNYNPKSNYLNSIVPDQPYSQPTIQTTQNFQNLNAILTGQPATGQLLMPSYEQMTNFTTNIKSPKVLNTYQDSLNSPNSPGTQKLRSKKFRSNTANTDEIDDNDEYIRNLAAGTNSTNTTKGNNKRMNTSQRTISKMAGSTMKTSTLKSLNQNQKVGERLAQLEEYINKIKESKDGEENEMDIKKKTKAELQTKVDILKSNLRNVHRENKTNTTLKKVINNENDKMKFLGERAKGESYVINKEVGVLREEVENMKQQILSLNEETQFCKNEQIIIEKDILMFKDEIKKINALITLGCKDRDKVKGQLVVIQKHNEETDKKIIKIDEQDNEFMRSVGQLMKERTSKKAN